MLHIGQLFSILDAGKDYGIFHKDMGVSICVVIS